VSNAGDTDVVPLSMFAATPAQIRARAEAKVFGYFSPHLRAALEQLVAATTADGHAEAEARLIAIGGELGPVILRTGLAQFAAARTDDEKVAALVAIAGVLQ
jgi:hypothetical protein